ncbi:MAG: flavodoxin FldA [Dysgonamonadaceae bacterium]|jgi:flavodoxin I|nr:flavodoxin FldA [Dysgonamonadaceae bacterium]
MKSIIIIYGSSTDNTRDAAEQIAKKLADFSPEIKDVAKVSEEDFLKHDVLILGTSTMGIGDLQDDWDTYLPKFQKLDLSGKTVALFGLGDSAGYSDSFVDGMGTLYKELKNKDVTLIGKVLASDYSFDESTAVEGGSFVGLALDADNEHNKTAPRIAAWVEAIKPFLK